MAFSSDNRQIVSGSRDKTIKLWNTLGVCKYTVQVGLETTTPPRVDFGEKTGGFGPGKRRSVFCSAWFCVFQDESHSEWVSCVRFSPNSSNPIIVSCGWDKLVKVKSIKTCFFPPKK